MTIARQRARATVTLASAALASTALLADATVGAGSAGAPSLGASRPIVEVPARWQGKVTIDFHGSRAAGCARFADCEQGGTIRLGPGGGLILA